MVKTKISNELNFLAVDYGKRYVGLAIASSKLKIAMPYGVLQNKSKSFLFSSLKKIIAKEKIKKIIIGRPIGLSGRLTLQTKIVDKFIQELRKEIKLPIVDSDERLTSKLAEKLSSGNIENHSVAAMIIIRDYLNQNRF